MIRPARPGDAKVLTRISFASKKYWNYPEEYFEIWKNELTVTADYIAENEVFVYGADREIIGYYAVRLLPEDLMVSGVTLVKGFWLEHLFINPGHIGKGIGTRLFQHLRRRCEKVGIRELGVLSDPNARGFYEKMGFRYLGEHPSTIKGRTTPHLRLQLPFFSKNP
jgi:GNAT superfamily N-acetyltransferase